MSIIDIVVLGLILALCAPCIIRTLFALGELRRYR